MWLKDAPELKQTIAAHLFFEKSVDIEKIKSFYEEAQHSYNEPYFIKKWSFEKKEHAAFPLGWALRNHHLDFALWLIKDQHVDISQKLGDKENYLHYLARDMKKDGPLVKYEKLIKNLARNEGAINRLNWNYHTPLLLYMSYGPEDRVRPEIIKLFFAYGTHIVDHRGKHSFIDINRSWYRGMQELLTCKGGPRIIPYLFKMKLDAGPGFTDVNYRNSLCYAKEKYDTSYRLLSLVSKRALKGRRLLKHFIHIICELAVRDYEDSNEIKESIETFRSWEEEWDTEGQNTIVNNPLFKQIMTHSFWNNPLPVCYEAVDTLVQIKN